MKQAQIVVRAFQSVCLCLMLAGPMAAQDLPPRAEVDLVRCEMPPRIDGDLSDACWAKAANLGGLRKPGTGEDAGAGQARICADDQWLYLSCDIPLPHVQKMQTTVLDHDGQVCNDDSVELFLDPGTQGKFYYHFMLSAANVQAERKCFSTGNKDLAWSIPWRSATKVTDKGWQAEIAIPLGFLAREPTWKNLALNLGVTRLLLTLNPAGERIAMKRDYSSWSAVRGTFHETSRFGLVRKMEGFKAREAFMAMVEQARVGKYGLMENGGFGYTISGVLRNASDLPGAVALVVEDKPAAGKESSAKQEFVLKPSETLPFTFIVPVADFSARIATIKIQDAATSEIFQSYVLREAAELRLMRSFPRLSYFTSEKNAEITCEFGLEKDSVKKLKLFAKTGEGKNLASAGADDGKLLVPMKDLALGANKLTVALCQADGKELERQGVTLVKRAPKSGCEYKIDRADKVLLDNGKPFFPFGAKIAIQGNEDAAMMKDVADAGFNTVIRNGPVDYGKQNEFFELAEKNGLKVIEAPSLYKNAKLAREQLEPRTNMSPLEKSALLQDLVYLPGILAIKDRTSLITYYLSDAPGTDPDRASANLRFHQKLDEQDGYHPDEIVQVAPMPEGEAFLSNCDIFGILPIWVPGSGPGDFGTPHHVGVQTWSLRQKADRALKLTWVMPVAERPYGKHLRILLGKEQNVQTYLALIHGAKGLFYKEYPFIHQGMYDAFKKLGREMKVLGPACVAHELDQTIAYSPVAWDPAGGLYPDVEVSLKRNPSGGYILLAANWRAYPVDARIEIPALAAMKKLTLVFDEKQEFSVEGGRFFDSIEAMGTRAYAIDVKELVEPVSVKVELKGHVDKTDSLYTAQAELVPRKGVKNLLANSSFEQDSVPGMPDYDFEYYWLKGMRIGDTRGDCGISIVNDQPYEGSQCLRVTKGMTVNYVLQCPPQPGVATPVVFSVYARSDDEKGATVTLIAHDAAGQPDATGGPRTSGKPIALTKEWQRVVLPVTMPAQRPTWGYYFFVCTRTKSEGKSVWLDAMQLEQGPVATAYER